MGTTRILKTAAVTGMTLAAAGLGVAAPAAADSQTHSDPRGDVVKLELRQPAAAAKAGIDVVGLKNKYEGEKLSMSLTAAHLQRKGYQAEWEITAGDSTYFVLFDHTKKKPVLSFYDVTPDPMSLRIPRGVQPTCLDAQSAVKGESVTAAVPRSCIADANRVRIAGILVVPSPPAPVQKVDDSRHKGFDGDLTLGPVLKRN